ncbi:DUF6114 domain-containing protein [Streptomyces qinzhouensis]|uniref:Monovalent cation/H(+) antiporter subunit G n=1 Tax=Streptomyces qinzhouensis TaxID=2599401 RepID=A0A5B8JGX0_9ACTN|nr:DUF6114 domain-containing protein [Streptomyces qinzhouensis]QDY79081.1 hypothetical protein FQU76_24030 [Streptomyces qinzhouensis]
MSADSMATAQNEHVLRVVRRRFRDWRGQRPFWAGLFTMFGGVPIAYFPYATLSLGNVTLSMSTTAGAGALIIGVLLVTLGFTMWFHHIVRVFAGIAAILLALISIPVANLGGFGMGFLLALVGGALSVAWAPGRPIPAEAAPDGPAEESHPAAAVPDPAPAGPPVPPVSMEKAEVPQQTVSTEPDGGRNSAG